MSHVSISRSYAVLVGLESYVRTRRRVKTAEKVVVREKDKLLNPGKLQQEEEANRDKSQSAEKERLWLEDQQRRAAEVKHQEQQQGSRSFSGRISRVLLKIKSRKNSVDVDSSSTSPSGVSGTPSRVPGTGPEDGIPAPEGQR